MHITTPHVNTFVSCLSGFDACTMNLIRKPYRNEIGVGRDKKDCRRAVTVTDDQVFVYGTERKQNFPVGNLVEI